MTLPPIPDEAVVAVRAALGSQIEDATGYDPFPDILAAAWPHLYAAALRHAADQWEAEPDYYDGPYISDLRKWAATALTEPLLDQGNHPGGQ